MKKMRERLLQMGLLFSLLWGLMLLGGLFEGGISLPAGLGGLTLHGVLIALLCRGLRAGRTRRVVRARRTARIPGLRAGRPGGRGCAASGSCPAGSGAGRAARGVNGLRIA